MRGLKLLVAQGIKDLAGRTPQGVRGLKCTAGESPTDTKSRTPQGVRGLKFDYIMAYKAAN